MKLAGGLWALNKSVQNSIKSLWLLFLTKESVKDRSSKSNLRSLKDAVPAPDLNSLANESWMGRKAEGLCLTSLQELQMRPSKATHHLQTSLPSKSVNLSSLVLCLSSFHILHKERILMSVMMSPEATIPWLSKGQAESKSRFLPVVLPMWFIH